MKPLVILTAGFALLFCATHPLEAQEKPPKPRIATVDMQKLFGGYYKTAEAQKEVNVERSAINKENNERLARIRDIATEANKINTQRIDSSLPKSRQEELFKDYQAKLQEHQQLDQEHHDFVKQTNEQLNEKMLQRAKAIGKDFLRPVEAHARTGNFDYVSSSSLTSWASAEAPFLAYTGDAANATDITDLILKEINKDAPADFQPPKESRPAASQLPASSSRRNASSPHTKLRIAKVDLSKLVRAHYRTSEIEKAIDLERARVQQDNERQKAIGREKEAEIENIQKQIEDPATIEARKKELLKNKRLLNLQLADANRDRRESLQRRNAALEEKSRQRMKSVSEEIQKIVIERCKVDGFDFVADRFAQKASADGPFLFSTTPTPDGLGAMTDVTDVMLQEINKNAPAGFQSSSTIPPKL